MLNRRPRSNGGANGTEAAAGEEAAEPEVCELCGKPMQLKRGRFGPFLGCTGYPECRNIRKIAKSGVAAPAPVPLDEKCPVDDAQLVQTLRTLWRVYLLLKLSEVQIHQAGIDRRCTARGPVAKASWSSRNRSAAKCFMAAPRILIAIEFIGTSRLRKPAQTATRRFCSRRRRRSKARFVTAPTKNVAIAQTKAARKRLKPKSNRAADLRKSEPPAVSGRIILSGHAKSGKATR